MIVGKEVESNLQTMEKMALIGGSILLSSTLIFTLKDQVSRLLPQTQDNMSAINDDFYKSPTEIGLKYAKKHTVQQGHWGTAQYYIDDQNRLYVEGGQLQGTLTDVLGKGPASMLQSINFTDTVQTPPVSGFLFSASDGQRSNLRAIEGLDKVDTSQTTDMSNMFTNDTMLRSLDLSHWDVSHVHDLGFIFYNLKALNYLDVSNWNTSQVTNLNSFMANDISTGILKFNHWDTSKVTNMSFAFMNNWALNDLEVSNWNVSQVTTMESMFSGDGTYTHLNLSGWEPKSLQNGNYTFANNFALRELDLGHWNTSQLPQKEHMFDNTHQLSWKGDF